MRRPVLFLLRDFRVRMTLGRIIHVWVNTAFEDIFEILGFSVRFTQEIRQMNVKESRDMARVEQTNVPQINRLVEQH